MILIAMKAIDLTVGDKGQIFFMNPLGDKALLSGQSGRLFRQGTAPANALQFLQGKDMQQENLNETYIDAIPAVLQTAFTPFKIMFPKRFGSTILSKADLKKASALAQANANKAQFTMIPLEPVVSEISSDEGVVEL